MGHGKPGKSLNLSISVSRHGIVSLVVDIVCVVRKLLQVSKQGQNKIQASYLIKYLKTRMTLKIFDTGS